MDLAICIVVKNHSNLVVNQGDSIDKYKDIQHKVEITHSKIHFPPTLNRDQTVTLNVLPKMLLSLVEVKKPGDKWTVIIVDYESTDVNVEAVAQQILVGQMDLVVHKEIDTYSKEAGHSITASIAKQRNHECLFFSNPDMYFTDHIIFDKADQELKNVNIYSPECFSFIKPDHLYGYWKDNCGYFIRTEDYFSSKYTQRSKSYKENGYFQQWNPNS